MRIQTAQRLTVIFVCLLVLIAVGVFAQGDGGKTWDDAVELFNQAVAAYHQARFQDAIDLYERALVIMRELRQQRVEGVILNNLGNCYYYILKYQRAIDCYEQALAIFRELGDRAGEADTLNSLGTCYQSLADYQRAIDYYEQALAFLREIEDRAGEVASLGNLGICYSHLSDYQRAIGYYKQALAIFRDIADSVGKANSLMGLGICYESLSDHQRAMHYHEQALAIFREIGNLGGEANSLGNLGNCHFSLSEYQRAIGYHEQSLAIFREIGDLGGEANSLGNLGNCYYSLSNYQRAIDYHEQALAISRDLGERAIEAATLGNLGVCYESLSDYQRAISYHMQALAIFVDIGGRVGAANSLNNLGICYVSLSDYQRAISYYMQALAIFVDIDDRTGKAKNLANLGNCYWHLSEYQKAIQYHEQALAIKREIGDRAGKAKSLNSLGTCYVSLSDYQQAIAYYEQALALSVELGDSETEQLVYWGLGRTYKTMEQPERALSCYEAAIEIVESIRGMAGSEELRQSYFGSLRKLYEEYLELLLELGKNPETLLVAERLRARTFLDTLYQSGLAPEQLQLNEAGIDRTSGDVLPVMDYDLLKLAVEEAQSSLLPNEAVLEYMVRDDGIYVWILTAEETLGPEFIPYNREQLMRDVVALRQAIEPQTEVVNDQTEIIFSDPSARLGAFYELLIQPVLSELEGDVDTLIIIPSGPLWYVPFSALMMTDQPNIEFGPGGAQQFRQCYLLDKYTLAFLPSLASLPMLMEERAPSTAMYLALANPTLSESQQEEVGSRYQFPVLETTCLAFAECMSSIDLSVQEQVVYVQKQALESRAHNEASGHEVLIYACHGVFNPSVPLDSRLLLAPSLEADDESIDRRLSDGNYYAFEVILTDHTGVDLVILAACETLLPTLREVQGALGMTLGPESDEKLNAQQLELIVAGDEVVGLSRAFLSSGAGSVLGTLWQANPTAINELLVAMCDAYSAEAGSWAAALREAQYSILEESISTFTLTYQTGLAGAHPWFWGAYQLVGRWR